MTEADAFDFGYGIMMRSRLLFGDCDSGCGYRLGHWLQEITSGATIEWFLCEKCIESTGLAERFNASKIMSIGEVQHRFFDFMAENPTLDYSVLLQ